MSYILGGGQKRERNREREQKERERERDREIQRDKEIEKGRGKNPTIISRWKGAENCKERGGKSDKDGGRTSGQGSPFFLLLYTKGWSKYPSKGTYLVHTLTSCKRHRG